MKHIKNILFDCDGVLYQDLEAVFGQVSKRMTQYISKKLKITGVQLAASKGRGFEWKIRTFAPVVGVSEDPICGSGNIALAKLLSSRGIAKNSFVSRQGQEVGRDGEILIRYLEGDEIELGGAAKIIASGRLDL